MSLGGFNGSDPYPTLAEFQALVRAGKVHYFIAGGDGRRRRRRQQSMSAITSWVKSAYSTRTVGGTTLYDLSSHTDDCRRSSRRRGPPQTSGGGPQSAANACARSAIRSSVSSMPTE